MGKEKVRMELILCRVRVPRFSPGDWVTPSDPERPVASSNSISIFQAYVVPGLAYEVNQTQHSHGGHWIISLHGIAEGFWFYAEEFELVCDELGDEYEDE